MSPFPKPKVERSQTVSSCKIHSDDHYVNEDSGTSSPQPSELRLCNFQRKLIINHSENEDESDSNDSVFSSGSSECSTSVLREPVLPNDMRDIYLGGSCVARTKWREDLVIPLLKRKRISYYLPTLHESLDAKYLNSSKKKRHAAAGVVTNGLGQKSDDDPVVRSSDERLEKLSIDYTDSLIYSPQILDSSRVLLFVITNETRSLAPMTLAAHYIGMGYNVILCVQMLPDDCVIGNDTVSFSNGSKTIYFI
jgi:raw